MKKLIGTVVVAALLASAAFAEGISFGQWGRGLWSIGNAKAESGDKNEVTSWISQSWGGPSPRLGLAVKGNSENVGFAVDFHVNGTNEIEYATDKKVRPITLGDNAFIWVKPIEMLTISLAASDDRNVLRSGACFGLYNFARIGAVGATNDDGFIFPGLLNKNVSVVATPIDGLTIGAGFDSQFGKPAAVKDGNRLVDQLGRTLGIAAAYTIGDIGTVKAGLSTHGKGANKDGEKKDLIKIYGAFELTSVENVFVAVGATIPVGGTYSYDSTTGKVGNQAIKINAYGRLSMIENLTINLSASLAINAADNKPGDVKKDGAFGFGFGGEVEYALSNGITVFGDVRYANGILLDQTSADKKDTLTFGAGLWKGFSNGNFGVAFEATTNGVNAQADIYDNAMAWQVPVRWEYSF
jgi:hypothetical protein